nr:ribosome silencing factor [Maliibacterium massiliense]
MQSSEALAGRIAGILEEKKAKDIVTLDISNMTVIAERFVIASGSTSTQVHALVDAVEETLKEQEQRAPLREEGYREGRWAVIDYGDVIVHIFHQEERAFYNLERLWMDEKKFTFHPDGDLARE